MNPIRKLCLCPLVLILTVLLSRPTPTIAITIDELADICGAMEDSILDVTVEYEFSVEYDSSIKPLPPGPKSDLYTSTGPSKIKWTGAKPFSELSKFSRDEILKDTSGKERSVHISTSYNGKVAKKYIDDDLPKNTPSGIVTNKENFMPVWSKTPLIYTSYFFQIISGCPLQQILRGKDTDLITLDNEIRKVNGFNTIRVDEYIKIEGTKAHSKSIYFSPEHNFAIVKIELYNGQKSTASFDVLELEEVKNGIWFPVHGCRSGSSPSVPKNIIKATSKVIVNQGLNKEDFNIEFPPGTRITNEISGLSYVSEAPEDQNDTVTTSTIHDSEPTIEAQRPQPLADTQKSNKTILYISIAAVIVLLSALTVKKYV